MTKKISNIVPLNMSETLQTPQEDVERGSRARNLTSDEQDLTEILHSFFEKHLLGTRACAKSSVKNAMGVLTRFQKYVGLPPWEWKESDLAEFLAHKAQNYVAASTQAQYITYLRAFQNLYLEDVGLLNETRRQFGKQPCRFVTDENAIPIKRKRHKRKKIIKPLTPVQCQQLIEEYDHQILLARRSASKSYNPLRRDKTMSLLTLMTGARVDELVKISINSFKRDKKHPQFGDFALLTVIGKGSKTRTIRLYNPMVRELLEWYIKDVRPRFFKKDIDDPNLLFYSERGIEVCTEQVRRALTKIASSAGITHKVTPHMLRHTYATEMKDTLGPENLQKQLGHEHLSTTLCTYYHPDPEKVGDEVRQGIEDFGQAIYATIEGIDDEDYD